MKATIQHNNTFYDVPVSRDLMSSNQSLKHSTKQNLNDNET